MSLSGKNCLVTGANTGLGYETSLGLARRGYTVVLACRDEEKARQAAARIEKEVPTSNLEILPLDLIDRDSIRGFAPAQVELDLRPGR